MANENLARLTETQLTSLFYATGNYTLSERAKEIINEMERRGFIFDVRRRAFISCEEWNNRYGHNMPLDCERLAKKKLTRR